MINRARNSVLNLNNIEDPIYNRNIYNSSYYIYELYGNVGNRQINKFKYRFDRETESKIY